MHKRIIQTSIAALLALGICGAFASETKKADKLETGKSFIANGSIKVDVLEAPNAHLVNIYGWSEEANDWEILLYGRVGIGALPPDDKPYERLHDETAEQIQTEQRDDSVILSFILANRTGDLYGKADSSFHHKYQITIRMGKHTAEFELVEGTDIETAWMFYLAPKPARLLVGAGILYPGNFVDCAEEFQSDHSTTIMVGSSLSSGAYSPQTGNLYTLSFPSPHNCLASVSEEGVRMLAPLASPFTLGVTNIGTDMVASDALGALAEINE
jgi:hypothetical protein